jgi:hypothetical protein
MVVLACLCGHEQYEPLVGLTTGRAEMLRCGDGGGGRVPWMAASRPWIVSYGAIQHARSIARAVRRWVVAFEYRTIGSLNMSDAVIVSRG